MRIECKIVRRNKGLEMNGEAQMFMLKSREELLSLMDFYYQKKEEYLRVYIRKCPWYMPNSIYRRILNTCVVLVNFEEVKREVSIPNI